MMKLLLRKINDRFVFCLYCYIDTVGDVIYNIAYDITDSLIKHQCFCILCLCIYICLTME